MIKNENKISVIIPVYNIEKYLRKCLDSVVGQTYKNLEIILVNDGSTDSCLEICREYEKKDTRIVVIDKINGGLSDARNAGLSIATGDYIFLIDSDDSIELDTLEVMYNAAKYYNSEIVVCNFIHHIEESNYDFLPDTDAQDIEIYKQGIDFYKMSYIGKGRDVHCNAAWGKLYKSFLFNDILYPVGKIHEDEWTTYKLVCKANVVVYLNKPFYRYLIRSGSIMHKRITQKNLSKIDAFAERYTYFSQKKEIELAEITLKKYLGAYIVYYYKLNDVTLTKKLYDRFKKAYNVHKKECSLLQSMQYRLFLFSPALYKKIRRIN